MLKTLTRHEFEPLLGDSFHVRLEDTEVDLVLTEADDLGSASPNEQRTPFALLFVGPPSPRLRQGTYRLEHPGRGPLDIFLVPIDVDASGAPRYEAIFN
jgi:hypothetical protein